MLWSASIGQVADAPEPQPSSDVPTPRDPGQSAADEIERVVAELDSPDFAERRRATDRLIEQGRAAMPAVRHILRHSTSPELRARASLAAQLLFSSEQTVARSSAFLGIVLPDQRLDGVEPAAGVEVQGLLPHLAADRAGLRVGDVITAINDQPAPALRSSRWLQDVVSRLPVQHPARLKVERDGQTRDVIVMPTQRPEIHPSIPLDSAKLEDFEIWYRWNIDATADDVDGEHQQLSIRDTQSDRNWGQLVDPAFQQWQRIRARQPGVIDEPVIIQINPPADPAPKQP